MSAPNEAFASILALAESIVRDVKTITGFLQEKNLPAPGLDIDAPSPDFLPAGNKEIHDLRKQVVENSNLLADVFTGARKHLMNMCTYPNHQSTTMAVMYHYKIPQLVPLQGSISYKELSDATGLDEDRLTRILRFLILNHIFDEVSLGRVSHSAASRLIAEEKASMDFVGHCLDDIWPGCSRQVEALKRAPHGQTGLDCGAALALSEGKKAMFESFMDDPQRMQRFSGAMEFINTRGAYMAVTDELGTNFDWQSLPEDTKIVDVGGSQGHTAREVLKIAPNIKKIIVQDLPPVIEAATTAAAAAQQNASKNETDSSILPSSSQQQQAQGTLEFQAADFFTPQPVTDADIYLFRYIFHDWSDSNCAKILSNLVPSMKSGSRLIVNEAILRGVLETRSSSSSSAEQDESGKTVPRAHRADALFSSCSDLQMMVAVNAKERTLAEWQTLIETGSEGELVFESVRGSVLVFRRK